MRKFSVGEALRFGTNTAWSNLPFFIAVGSIVWLIHAVPHILNAALPPDRIDLFFIINLTGWILAVIVELGFLNIILRFAHGKKANIADLFKHYEAFFPYIFAAILYGLIVLAGLVLFIIPGIIWSLRFQFFGFLILEHDLGPIEALKRSFHITRGSTLKLLGFSLLFILINFMGALCLLVGLLFTVPLTMLALAYIYHKLTN